MRLSNYLLIMLVASAGPAVGMASESTSVAGPSLNLTPPATQVVFVPPPSLLVAKPTSSSSYASPYHEAIGTAFANRPRYSATTRWVTTAVITALAATGNITGAVPGNQSDPIKRADQPPTMSDSSFGSFGAFSGGIGGVH
ncbi:hypothetical protein J2X57_001915 [Luteibacter sp. 1214]|uniref:hypothetical protein n=1 Tax=Luteibacter sp. 1214 TaxID=2817735 RepID=UPI0028586DF0|nr:hypothetical protein [Luteibacter sp. 1214]MDR6642703.1 hypothetical protein [Luteibacter sp. 1214]